MHSSLREQVKPARVLAGFAITVVAFLTCGRLRCQVRQDHWVGTWACSPQILEKENVPASPALSGNTLRQIVHVSLGGSTLRLRLSNEFGTTPLVIQAVQVAVASGSGGIQPRTERPVTFNGQATLTIPAGAATFSDPVDFVVSPLSDLAVTMQFGKLPDTITGHSGSRETSYLAPGNQVAAAVLSSAVPIEHWYVLDGIDVEYAGKSAAIVTLGDSITDGHGSITNHNTRWPDYLAQSLAARGATSTLGVLNEGIGGNRILRDGIGPNALSRFDRDVIAQTGVRWLIVLEGVNDIGVTKAQQGSDADTDLVVNELIQAYHQFILRAHNHGIKVYGATITPFGNSFYASDATLAARDKVNAWIRSSHEFDGVIDFDKAIRDPQVPEQLDPAADSGDHLHPNSEGYKRMAAAIDASWFKN